MRVSECDDYERNSNSALRFRVPRRYTVSHSQTSELKSDEEVLKKVETKMYLAYIQKERVAISATHNEKSGPSEFNSKGHNEGKRNIE